MAAGGVAAAAADGSVATVDGHNTTVNESDTAGVVTTNSVNATAVRSGLSISPSNISVQGGRADIAFLIDTSTSMDNQIQSVKEGLREFSNTLESQGVDARYAFVTFATGSGEPRYRVVQEYTSNFTETQRTLNNSVGTDIGGNEYSFDAINGTLADLNERSDAEEFIVTLTDEDTEADSNPSDPAVLADRLEAEGATLFAVTLPEGEENNLGVTVQPNLSVGRVANLTRDGRFFDIRDDFSTKFEDAISGAIVNRSSPLDVTVTQVQRSGFPEVDVYAEVTDADGNPITGLDAGDFTVTEDGVRQSVDSVETIGSTPGSDVSVALAIDRSGSMRHGTPSKVNQAEDAAIEFVRQLGSNDEGLIVSFATDTRIDQRWTRSNQELIDAIEFTPDGGTELYGGTIQAVEQAAPRSGRSAVIVLTDGEPDGDSATLSEAIDAARSRNVPVYTIGLGTDVREQDLRTLSAETGGDYYRAPTASDLGAIYQEISQQISNEYRITYTTTDTATDGTTRQVRTTVDNGTYQDSDTGQYTAPCAPLPTAAFTATESGLTVTFDAGASSGNGGSIAAYRWDFTNDGQIDATGRTVTHTYSSSGTYEARLTVEKGCGVSDITTQSVTVDSTGGAGGYTYRLPHALNTQQLSSAWGSNLVVNATSGATTVSIDADGDGTAENTTTLSAGETVGVSRPSEGAVVTSSDPVTVRYKYGSADFGAYEDGRYRYGVPEASMLGTEYYVPVSANSLDIAATTATTVRVDADGDGQFDTTRSLAANGTTTVDDIVSGAHVVADDPVHVVVENARWSNMDSTYASSLLPVSAAKQTYTLPGHPSYNTQNPTEKTGVYLAGTQSGTTVSVGGQTVTLSEGETTYVRTGAGSATVDASAPVVALYAVHIRSQDWWSSEYRENVGLATPVRPVEINAGVYSGQHFDGGLSVWSRYDPANVPSPQPSAEFAVSNLAAPATATVGDTVTVTADITNVGGSSGSQTVEFRLGGTVLTESLSLAAGQTEEVSFTVDTSGLAAGDYTHGVFTNDDNATATITLTSGGNGVTINATDATASQGGNATVRIKAEGAGVAGYRVQLDYDPSRLRVVDTAGVDFPDPVANVDNSAGSVVLSQSQTTAVSDPVLAELTVQAVGQPGQSAALRFVSSRTTLNDVTSQIPIGDYDASTVAIRSCTPGDANRDDLVTPLDATLVNRYVAGLSVPASFNADCADHDDSGGVTPLDATLILRDVAGLPTAAGASTAAPSAASTADLQVGSVRAGPGESVTVPLSVSGVDVAGYSAQISFDPNVVRVESATGVDLADPVVNIDNSSGTVTLSASQSTAVSDPTVAVLNLTVVGAGGDTSPLTLDPSGSTVNNVTSSHDITTTNGSVTVRSASGTQTAVEVVPASANTGVGGTQTFEVVLSAGSDSQGYDLSVSLSNGTVGRITDAETAGNPGLADTVRINSANDSVEIEGAYLNPLSGSAPLTIATVTVEGNAVGTTAVSIDSGSAVRDGNNDPYAITALNGATLSVQNAVTLPGAAGPAGDIDGDGLLEDVDGDGSANVFDAVALYNNRGAQTVQNNPQFFDFDGDGSVNVFDAIELYNEI